MFPFTTQDPILSTGIRHHGDKTVRERERERASGRERERWRPAGDTVTAGDNCSFECNIFTGLSLSLPLCCFFPHISQPRLLSRLQECAEPSECCVWFPWRFHAAGDSAKTQHAMTSQAPAPALVLLKHTKYTRKYTPAHEIPRLRWLFGARMFSPDLWTLLLDSFSSRVFKHFQEIDSLECELVTIFVVGDEDFLYLLCSFVFFLLGWTLYLW